jgi:outer membrane protein
MNDRYLYTIRKIQHSLVGVLILLLPGSSIVYAEEQNAPVSIAVVNVTDLVQRAPQAKIASENLKKKFFPQERQLDEESEQIQNMEKALQKEKDSLDHDAKVQREREIRSRRRHYNRAVEDFRENLRIERAKELEILQKSVSKAIDEVRKAEKIDIVIQEYVSASKRVDITKKVFAYLEKKLEEQAAQKEDTQEETKSEKNE